MLRVVRVSDSELKQGVSWVYLITATFPLQHIRLQRFVEIQTLPPFQERMGASKSVQRPAKPDHLFILPLEIRRAIYTYLLPEHGIHLSQIENGETRLSACCDPDLYNHEMGLERLEFVPPAKDDQVWQKRLLSPWGPHWRCEEEVRMGLRASGESLLGVCKAT